MKSRTMTIAGLTVLTLTAPNMATAFATPALADAVTPIVWCDDGYYLRTFSSGLTSTPHDFTETIIGALSDCTSPAISGDPTVNGVATFRGSGTGTGSCTDDGTMSEAWEVEWANGRTSTITFSTTVKAGKASILSTGTVTAGEFMGTKIIGIPIAADDNVACGTQQGMTDELGRIPTLVAL